MTASASSLVELSVPLVRAFVRPGSSVETTTAEYPHVGPARSVAQFEWLARNDPAELARLALGDLKSDPVLLSEAAEAMAMSHRADLIVPVLLELMKHPRPFVRESALVGIAPFLSESLQGRDVVRELAQFDPSPGVRDAAADVLAVL